MVEAVDGSRGRPFNLAAAVFVPVGGVDGGALGTVHGDGIPESQPVGGGFLGGEGLDAAVVHPGRQGARPGIDLDDPAPFAGDQSAVGAGGEGDDAVSGGVAAAAGGGQFRSRQPSLDDALTERLDEVFRMARDTATPSPAETVVPIR